MTIIRFGAADNNSQSHRYILGLDIGIDCCGWALVSTDNPTVIDLGVHLWNPPQEKKTGASLAASRREARSSRRNTKRTADRKKHCLKLFINEGLVPEDATKEWFQTAKGDISPLHSRAQGLDRLLSDREWAQVLYSICGRRGYIPHGEGSDDKDGKKILDAIEANRRAAEESGSRTAGEFLANQPSSRNKSGDYSHCIANEDYLAEVAILFEKQREFGNKHTSERFLNNYLECLTWQKDARDRDAAVYAQVGSCIYFSDERRAPKSCLSFEMCTAHEKLCGISISKDDGTRSVLPPEIRRRAFSILFSPLPLEGNKDCKVRYSDLRKWMDLNETDTFNQIDFDQEKNEVFNPAVWSMQRTSLPADLILKMRNSIAFADEIDSALTYASTKQSLREQLDGLNLSRELTDALVDNLPFSSKMFSGYTNKSARALQVLLDQFDDYDSIGNLRDAEISAGLYQLRTSKPTSSGYKLPPYLAFDPTCKDPMILRAVGRVRKVVNAIINQYGMPDEVHIEIDRELKYSQKEKDRIAKSNREMAAQLKTYRKEMSDLLNCSEEDVPRTALAKYVLWKEQVGRDLYCGENIELTRLLSDSAYCQIDHILPYSRTCDNSQMNKVLSLAKSSQEKGVRTPFEWLSETEKWEDFEKRVLALDATGYPRRKIEKLLKRSLSNEESTRLIEKSLYDTRYVCKAIKDYFEASLDFSGSPKRRCVYSVSSGATATLRNAWSLQEKDPEKGDLHHAVDAAIVAACNRSALVKVARASENKWLVPKDQRAGLFADTEPWRGFSETVQQLASSLIPTRMIDHKISHRLYQDTLYSYHGIVEGKHLAQLSAAGKIIERSNYALVADGKAAILPDGMYCLKLWWSPSLKNGSGGYLAEPVYYSDLASLFNGSYIARYWKKSTARINWPRLPQECKKEHPITLFEGTAFVYKGALYRYRSFDIDGGLLRMVPIRQWNHKPVKRVSASAIKQSELVIIKEDILGSCFQGFKEIRHP